MIAQVVGRYFRSRIGVPGLPASQRNTIPMAENYASPAVTLLVARILDLISFLL
jgi:hypothetical protein